MRNYKNYQVWQKSHELCLFVYKEIIVDFPKEEKYELASQLKRAAYSIPLNVVEGCGRNSEKDFVHFLDMAFGSLHEVEYCILLAWDLSYIKREKYNIVSEKINEMKAMFINLIKSIRK